MYGALNAALLLSLSSGTGAVIALLGSVFCFFSFHKLHSQMIKMTDTQSIVVEKGLALNKRLADISAATSVITAFLVVIAFLFSSE